MDIGIIRTKVTDWVKKYRYALIILAAGICLMLFTSETRTGDSDVPVETTLATPQLKVTESQLEEILSRIKGVGNVNVLLTYAAGEQTIFHTNTKTTEGDSNRTKDCDTVLITDNNRKEEALVTQVIAPQYMGAVIVCQGAENASVRLAVSEAVCKATGLRSDQIAVLSMN